MMTNSSIRKRLPPYVSYRTFSNFVDRLQQQIPARIDRSYWDETLSGSTGTQLVAALRFLGLIDNNSRPTERLKLLTSARGEQRTGLLKKIAFEAYGFALEGPLDLENATYSQLEEVLHETFRLTNEVSRKCIKFFISLATDAGITLSPFMTKRFRITQGGGSSSGTKNITKRTGQKTNRKVIIPNILEKIPDDVSWNTMLLAKFPTFDPTWSDEVKLKWFDAFDELMKRGFPLTVIPGAGNKI